MRLSIRRVAVAACVVVLAACAAASPEATVDSFDHLIEAGKYDQAYALLSSEARAMFPEAKMQVVMAEQSRKMKAAGGIKAINFSGLIVTGDTAKVTALTTLGNGTKSTDTVRLLRENGKWKIEMKK